MTSISISNIQPIKTLTVERRMSEGDILLSSLSIRSSPEVAVARNFDSSPFTRILVSREQYGIGK